MFLISVENRDCGYSLNFLQMHSHRYFNDAVDDFFADRACLFFFCDLDLHRN